VGENRSFDMPPVQKTKKSAAAQEFVPIKEVRGGVMILKDGTLVGVLLASSVNFALKSEDEQNAIIMQFQSFLNSLDFSVQLFIQSRKLDIRPYVALLDERLKAQTDDLMKIQVREYIEFIKTFTEEATIMSKRFFVVVPYSPPILNIKKALENQLFGSSPDIKMKSKDPGFEEHRTQLEQRMSTVQGGLASTGVRTVPLGTEEVIELLYKQFNPGELEKPIVDDRGPEKFL
jgi:type IV secretory pathway VirB4 component